ncbi:D-Ala-D-Ala carboxypeptidase family metallohydrolase [Sphingomonas sp. BK580]|uniref:D-Ala-D-Ala carboxypeptidase family metallohydrolase n=1 Tax=Sphingomonas sp. BK580 TaxID=2586972 RepID=UPI00160D1601|nr:D-Ala-D-Ala carboxypeptidase family metallohydrolase [Sphingomonas sp. BK580]MBB3691451.1 hypothetical protein [Sphingomonas sp. BK580]
MRSVGIRLGTVGKGEVVADLREIGTTGDAAFDRIAKRAVRSGEEAQAAIAKAERDARKLETLMPGLTPGKLDMYAGTRENVGKSAESSAAVFAAAYEKMEERAEALRRAIDPLYMAQQRFDAEIGEARTLMAAGVLSLDDYSKAAWRAHENLEAAGGTAQRTAKRSGSSFAAAAPQIQDFFTQVSMGGNAINAFVVQGGQLVGQLQYAQGAVGNFARFMMGPWGVAIQVAVMVLGPLVSKLWEESEASKKAKEAAEAHRKAVLDLADAQGKALQTAERKQAIDVANIKIELDATLATRKRTEAELQAARARLVAAQATQANAGGTAPGLMSGVAGANAAMQQGKIDELTAALKVNASEVERLEKGFQLGFNRLIGMRVEATSTPQGKVEATYQRDLQKAMETLIGDALVTRQRQLIATRDAELERIRKAEAAERALGKARADTETLTSNAVAKMLREAIPGVHVTSTTRTAEHNRAIGGAPNSNHVRGNAIDFVPAGGMSSMTKDDVRRIFESRGIDVIELLGPGDKGHSDHFHVAWTKGKLSLDEFNDAAKRTREELELLTKISAGAHDVDVLDVMKARADDFNNKAAQILGFDRDPQALRIATGQELVANDNADREVEQRRLDLGKERIQSLASFYQDVFTNGTGTIWDLFRQMGMRALSDLLAKWTVGKDGSGAGGLLGSVLSLFGKGGGSGVTPGITAASTQSSLGAVYAPIPKLASGTEYWSGGAALLGEHGPERAWLPRGTRVSPAGETRRAANDDARAPAAFHFDLRGAVVTADLLAQMNAMADASAVRGASGGAAIAQAEGKASAVKKLGRRW